MTTAAWHLITGEYPPQVGGVSDYAHTIAGGLAEAGDTVHVWCPPAEGTHAARPGVVVHRDAGRFAPGDLRRLGRALDSFPAPRRLLVQWVPHAFGTRSLNLPFCLWLWERAARRGDRVELMVHEPGLPFGARSWRLNAAAAGHRVMTAVLLRAAERVWVSAPGWIARMGPYRLGRRVPVGWLPIPTGVPVAAEPAAVEAVRAALLPRGGLLLGHFGLFGEEVAGLLHAWLPPLLAAAPDRTVVLVGRGGDGFRDAFLVRNPSLAGRVRATGSLPPRAASHHLSACDLLIQPYPTGVNARRSSLVAGLAHGTPIVTTTGPSTEPFWAESGAVALAPEDERCAPAAVVEALLGNAAERLRLAAAGRDLYDRRFHLRHTIAALRSGGP
jgi:glycosyltransferase involved in cell wall biosynthesis